MRFDLIMADNLWLCGHVIARLCRSHRELRHSEGNPKWVKIGQPDQFDRLGADFVVSYLAGHQYFVALLVGTCASVSKRKQAEKR